jgi:hypothetical protein
MTMISAFITKGIPTNDAITVYLACDSRVNFASDNGVQISYTDKASKVIILNDFLVIAYAGDYYKANLAIETINQNSVDINKNIYSIALDISNQLQESFEGENTSFLLCIKNDNWNVYEVDSETFIPKPKLVGLHLLGMGEEEQSKFREAHDQAREEIINPSSLDGFYTTPLLSAYHQCFNQGINGIVSFYVLNKFEITRPGIGVSNDSENWLVYSPEKNSTTRFVNGNPFGSTNVDFREIKTNGNKYYNDLRKFLIDKRK